LQKALLNQWFTIYLLHDHDGLQKSDDDGLISDDGDDEKNYGDVRMRDDDDLTNVKITVMRNPLYAVDGGVLIMIRN